MPTFKQNRETFTEAVEKNAIVPVTNAPAPQVPIPIADYPAAPNSFLRTPLPALSVQQPDMQRQWQSGAVSQARISPASVIGNAVANASAASQSIVVVQNTPATSSGVTSVGLALPKEFIVTGSPVTTAGTLTGAWASETPGYVLQAPPPGLTGYQGSTSNTFLAIVGGGTLTLTQTPTSATSLAFVAFNGGTNASTPSGWTAFGGASNFFYKAVTGTSPVSVSLAVGSQIDFEGSLSLFNGPAPTFVQSATSNTASGTLNFSSANTAGNTLVVFIRANTNSPASPISITMSDSNGNTYQQIVNQAFIGKDSGTNISYQQSVYICAGCFGGANAVTWSIDIGGGSPSTPQIIIAEFGPLPVGNGIPFFAPLSIGLIPPINLAASGNGGVGGILKVADGGTGVSTSTGTGNTVLSASPTFTGTVALPVVTLTGKATKYNNITTVANGVPSEYATVDLTAQGANVAATTAYAVPASGAGLYRVTVYDIVSRAATTSSTLPDTQIIFTDQDSSAVITVNVTPGDTGNTTSTFQQAVFVVNAKASTNIQYAIGQVTAFASSGGTSMQFAYRLRVEALG